MSREGLCRVREVAPSSDKLGLNAAESSPSPLAGEGEGASCDVTAVGCVIEPSTTPLKAVAGVELSAATVQHQQQPRPWMRLQWPLRMQRQRKPHSRWHWQGVWWLAALALEPNADKHWMTHSLAWGADALAGAGDDAGDGDDALAGAGDRDDALADPCAVQQHL